MTECSLFPKHAVLLVLLVVLAGCAAGSSQPQLPPGDADIVILGEVHDNPEHHLRQAELITRLAPSAVAFEMLTPEQAAVANGTDRRDATLAESLGWAESGWPAWSLYEPVFQAAGDATIYGMALPRDDVSRAVKDGAATVFGPGADRFGLTAALPLAQQAEREAHQQAVHCNALPEFLLPGMVEAQRLRDAVFARTALKALEDTSGPVAVITGTGHARTDWGMPVALKHAAPAVIVVSVGQLEESPEDEAPFDQWLVSEPAPREDPCEGFSMSGDS